MAKRSRKCVYDKIVKIQRWYRHVSQTVGIWNMKDVMVVQAKVYKTVGKVQIIEPNGYQMYFSANDLANSCIGSGRLINPVTGRELSQPEIRRIYPHLDAVARLLLKMTLDHQLECREAMVRRESLETFLSSDITNILDNICEMIPVACEEEIMAELDKYETVFVSHAHSGVSHIAMDLLTSHERMARARVDDDQFRILIESSHKYLRACIPETDDTPQSAFSIWLQEGI